MRTAGLLRELATGLASGVAGTTAMTTTTWVQSQLRHVEDIPVDYDATSHVVTAVARVLHHRPRSRREATGEFLLAHWGYGSAVAIGHRLLLRRLSRPRAAAVFFVGCQSMAFVLLPVLGETPPPWRWRRDVLASSLAHHAVYAVAVGLADRELARRGALGGTP